MPGGDKVEAKPPEAKPTIQETPDGRLKDAQGRFVSQKTDQETQELVRQLEHARQAAHGAHQRAQIEYQARVQEAQARQQAEWNAQSQGQSASEAQYDAVLNAIQATQHEAEVAKQDLQRAFESQDSGQVADAQWRLGQLGARLAQLEDGKTAYEIQQQQYLLALQAAQQQAAEQARHPPPQQPQRQPTVAEYIDNAPQFQPAERQWLRRHPEVLTDARRNAALQHHFYEAVNKYGRGTREYFAYLEQAMGYGKSKPQSKTQRASNYSAPPSRAGVTTTGVDPSPTRITLSAEQREAARISGISEIDYAKNVLKLNRLKKDGMYQ
jgi:hypothetical protein